MVSIAPYQMNFFGAIIIANCLETLKFSKVIFI